MDAWSRLGVGEALNGTSVWIHFDLGGMDGEGWIFLALRQQCGCMWMKVGKSRKMDAGDDEVDISGRLW